MKFTTTLLTLFPLVSLVFSAPPTPRGEVESINGVQTYLTLPPHGHKPRGGPRQFSKVIVYLVDIFGFIRDDARVLADEISGLSGYPVIMPDILNNDSWVGPAPGTPEFDEQIPLWLARHQPEQTEPTIDRVLEGVKRKWRTVEFGVTGYCFGGRYSFRLLGAGKVKTAVALHPSLVSLAEGQNVRGGPILIATADVDPSFDDALRQQIIQSYRANNVTYGIDSYGGVAHGWAVRPLVNPPRPIDIFSLEKARDTTAAWLKQWL